MVLLSFIAICFSISRNDLFARRPKMEDDLTYHLTDAEEEDDEVQEEKKVCYYIHMYANVCKYIYIYTGSQFNLCVL